MKFKLNKTGILTFVILIAVFILTVAVPDAPSQSVDDNSAFLAVLILILAAFIIEIYRKPKETERITDIFLILSVVIFLWEVLIGKLILLDPFLFPGPARVFAVFQDDYELIINGLFSSLTFLVGGYLLALALAIPAGLYIGWRKRLFNVAYPISKAISPIPPTAYLPYSIVLLPTFSAASTFLIFIGAFWPILVGTIFGVFGIDKRLINTARTLGLSERVMMKDILLPAALPSIFSGAMIALIISFITLTVAEMIAATSGLGWYIIYNHQFANYDMVVAGIIVVGAVVMVITYFFDRIQAYCLRWQNI
ncbi:ABC transporter permease subunit [Methanomicrobium antiquum]|uniref:ABC transporter permease subunit n=1 Tax=Methanomicrobium antiquum TaxID=487686 RepID=A0AAF0FRJ0_9EURY|nr:ABC transporter permease subunit [Methanomicrobium antiquum]MDD4126114.1 ABC transporter permease subunit [Methanomicrobium sp.]WFN37232.1 ABC transporter permease subunit [Methanomicrobium antiquum]